MLNALVQNAQMQNLPHMQNQNFHVFFSICDNLCFAFLRSSMQNPINQIQQEHFLKICLLQMHHLNLRIIPYGLANLYVFLISERYCSRRTFNV